MITKVLQMGFKNSAGDKTYIEVPNPRENLTGTEVLEAMENIILYSIFQYKMHDLNEAVDARVVMKDIQYFDLD